MQTFTRQRVGRARRAVDAAFRILAEEMLSASYWLEVRKAQDPDRRFGEAVASAWAALRAELSWEAGPEARPEQPAGEVVHSFLRETPAAHFFDRLEAPEEKMQDCGPGPLGTPRPPGGSVVDWPRAPEGSIHGDE